VGALRLLSGFPTPVQPAWDMRKGRTTRAPGDPVLVQKDLRTVTCVAGRLRVSL
jgi:hypothetical protein